MSDPFFTDADCMPRHTIHEMHEAGEYLDVEVANAKVAPLLELKNHWMGKFYSKQDEFITLGLENARLKAENELRVVQLARCGVAARGYLDGTDECKPGDWGYSQSYKDVKKLRLQSNALRALLARARVRVFDGSKLAEEIDAALKGEK